MNKLNNPLFKLYLQLSNTFYLFLMMQIEQCRQNRLKYTNYINVSHVLLKKLYKLSYLRNTPLGDVQFKNLLYYVKYEDVYF